jgi:proline iminopeptidase
MARIECHYFINDSFIQENQIIDNMQVIQEIPGIIVHGRYDMVCPVEQAVELHQAWPESHLNIIPDAGHSAFEPSIIHSLIAATRSFGDMLS